MAGHPEPSWHLGLEGQAVVHLIHFPAAAGLKVMVVLLARHLVPGRLAGHFHGLQPAFLQ